VNSELIFFGEEHLDRRIQLAPINPALFGMPDATTAGVPAGTVLTTYTGPMTITTDGTVIDGKIINGTLNRVSVSDLRRNG
jgi:hypothetical protein